MTNELRLATVEKQVERLNNIVFYGDGERPSLIVSLDRFTTQLETITKMIKLFWPVLLFLILVILGLAVTNTFFGPLLRHQLGLPDAKVQSLPQQSDRQNATLPQFFKVKP